MSQKEEEPSKKKEVVIDDGPLLEYIRKLLKENPDVEEEKPKV